LLVGGIGIQLRYLARYAEVLVLPFYGHQPQPHLFASILKLVVKLSSAILTFKPRIIFSFPSYPFGLPSAVIARLFRVVHVVFTYGNDVLTRKTRLGKLVSISALRLSQGIICDYEGLARLIRRMGGHNVVAIPDGIETSDFPAFTQPKKLENTIVCAINFNFAHSKGVDLLIRAIKEIPAGHLILIGKGSQRNAMVSLVKKMKLNDRITFPGLVPHKEIWSYLMKASLFAMTPRILEGSSKAVLEAMFCGLPVVVTRAGGLPELVDDGINGFVVGRDNLKELVKAIKTLLENPALREKMGSINKLKAKEYLAGALAVKRCKYFARLSQAPEDQALAFMRSRTRQDL